jgi:hypothetical protein
MRGWSMSHHRFAMRRNAAERRSQWRRYRAGRRSRLLGNRRRFSHSHLLMRKAGFRRACHRRLRDFVTSFYGHTFSSTGIQQIKTVVIVVMRVVVAAACARQTLLDDNGYIFIDGARMGLLFLNPKFRQQFKNPVWLDFQLSRQLIDSDFLLHI